MKHYIRVDLETFDLFVEWGIRELERLLANHAQFQALYPD